MEKVGRLSIRINLFNVCRHYIAKSVLRDNLDLMEMNKYNVFHWHMTDNQAFPFQSIKFPMLRYVGSSNPYVYISLLPMQ